MRLAAAIFVCIGLSASAAHAQHHDAAPKPAAGAHKPEAPKPAPSTHKPEAPKPSAEKAPTKVEAGKTAAAAAPQPAAPAKPSLEQAAEAIASAVRAQTRRARPAKAAGAGSGSPRRSRGSRYVLRWPDIEWTIDWPAASERVALKWSESPVESDARFDLPSRDRGDLLSFCCGGYSEARTAPTHP